MGLFCTGFLQQQKLIASTLSNFGEILEFATLGPLITMEARKDLPSSLEAD
jgi:hypothetical protein